MSLRPLDRQHLKQKARAYGVFPYVQGKVIEVGLGWGFVADEVVARDDFDSLDSYEKDAQAITDYTKKHDRHRIINADFTIDTQTSKFDTAIVDVFDGFTPEIISNAKAIVRRLQERMGVGSRIFIEYQSDTELERDFRGFMKRRFGKMHHRLVLKRNRATSRSVIWYKL